MILLAAEHFVRAPQWTWYVLLYFFLAGLAGGAYVLATLLRLSGNPYDEPAARIGLYISFPAIVLAPLLLTADLGAISWIRFWHMLINVTPGDTGVSFKYWSPMSVGAWSLLIFGFFSFVSFLDALLSDRRGAGFVPLGFNRIFMIIGSLLGLFVASYTGVLLSVSNQPVWSDTWALGGLFLASGLSGAGAAITLFTRNRPDAAFSLVRLRMADGFFGLLELALLIAFFVTVAAAGDGNRLVNWIALWVVALIGIGASLFGFRRPARMTAGSGSTAVAPVAAEATIISVIALIAVLAVRAAVIFSGQ
ncbi:MAG TPA: NrfD/PsrC family molybdoenzyme membrane anchor subunit [Candidatus Dormibacteraeota bacterium]|nr:NrfD/PsrC family molybdoenzyme membrane anchor subunit [Candidatus Dormibacteraeota bacterium]